MKKIQDFEKSSMILFVLMMGTNVTNYLFQILIGNIMTVEDYGTVNTLQSIVRILSIPTTIITIISARYIALNIEVKDENKISSVINVLFKIVLIVNAFLMLIGGLGASQISNLFKIDINYVIAAIILAVVTVVLSMILGIAQGMKKFIAYGMQNLVVALGKLFISIILVTLGWRVYGVIWATFLGTILAVLIGMKNIWPFFLKSFNNKVRSIIDLKEFINYSFMTIVAQGCIIMITNGDILLVKMYFTDTEAGVYSSAMVIGKIAMYVSSAVIATLFPMVVNQAQNKENTIPLLKKALVYGGGMSICCGGSMIVFGNFVINLLFGSKYKEAISFLPAVCLFVVPLTFLTILMNYVLAIGKAKFFGFTMAIGLLTIILINKYVHESIFQMISMCGAILTVIFIINIIVLIRNQGYYRVEIDEI